MSAMRRSVKGPAPARSHPSMALRRLGPALALVAFTALGAEPLPTVALSVKGHRLTAEVAATPATRTRGLMERFSLAPDHGMLFVFPAPAPQAFWMRNTYVPLSIAFIDSTGRIVNIEDMQPKSEESHFSLAPVPYALEMRRGWFRERGIGPGARVEGLERAPRARE